MQNKSLSIIFYCLSFIIITNFNVHSAEFHISKSWELELSLRIAAENGADDTIYLSEGSYTSTSGFNYESYEDKSLTIKAENNLSANQVILDGLNNYPVLKLVTNEKKISDINIENITIQNAVDFALHVTTGGDVLVNNCIIQSNKANIFISNPMDITKYVIFSNNVIQNNYSQSMTYIRDFKNIFITNNIFKKNNCKSAVIAIISDSKSFIKNNLIYCNMAICIIGIISTSGEVSIYNNIICNNKRDMTFSPSFALLEVNIINIINNTIFNNELNNLSFYRLTEGDTLNIINNIIDFECSEGFDKIKYKNAYNNNSTYNFDQEGWNSKNNFNKDAFFIDSENGDYHLRLDSPCINKGYNDIINQTDTDLDGNPRIYGGIVDIGAFEFSPNIMHPADTNQNWVIETNEFNSYNEAWKKGNLWINGPNPIPASYLTRSGFLMQRGGSYKNIGISKPLCWVPDN